MWSWAKKMFLAAGDCAGTLFAGVGLYVTIWNNLTDADKPMTLPTASLWLFALAFLFLIAKAIANWSTLTNSPDLALKILSVWESERLLKARRAAIPALDAYKNGLVDRNHPCMGAINDVLDIIEDIGAHVINGQMDRKVADHYFYHWVRGYATLAGKYIKDWHDAGEPDQWNHVMRLYDTLKKLQTKEPSQAEAIDSFVADEATVGEYPPPPIK